MLLAREGMNAEQLTRDLKSFELKPTFEDVFPIEAASVEEYLQQVHEMAMLSSVQGAHRDNLRSFDDYMLQVLEDDRQKESESMLSSFDDSDDNGALRISLQSLRFLQRNQ